MKRKHILYILLGLIFVSCSTAKQKKSTKPDTLSDLKENKASPLRGLNLREGMERKRVEEQIAKMLGNRSLYSPYGNNLRGGLVRYELGDDIIEIVYNAGSPAPTIVNEKGECEGLPPIDETLQSYQIIMNP